MEDEQRLGWFRFTDALTAEVLCEATGRLRWDHLQRRIGAARPGRGPATFARAVEVARHWPLDE